MACQPNPFFIERNLEVRKIVIQWEFLLVRRAIGDAKSLIKDLRYPSQSLNFKKKTSLIPVSLGG